MIGPQAAGPSQAPDRDAINVLVIDDNVLDANLSFMALRRGGVPVNGVIAVNERELREMLLRFVPDIVLCDFSFPDFDGIAAEAIVHAIYPNVPLIFVSGTISEERAAMALQSGAVDYVMKSSLIRLPSSVVRAVGSARIQARAEQRARSNSRRLETLWTIANEPRLRGQALLLAMLRSAAADICDPQPFSALLCRVEDDGIVVVGASGPSPEDPLPVHQIGERLAFDSPAPRTGGRSHAWNDIAIAGDVPASLAQSGWRALICTHFEVGAANYWLAFVSSEPAPAAFGDDDFAYLDVLASFFANQIQVNALQDSLRDEEERSRSHAQRLEASWQIVNDLRLNDADKRLAMLAQAAGSIWPNQGARAMLWRVTGDEMTLEAVAESPNNHLTEAALTEGTVWPVDATLVGEALVGGGGTRSWDDARSSTAATKLALAQGARSSLVTTFNAGNATWALSFISGLPPRTSPGPLEHAYLEVLASFFSNHVQQRWQFERIQYQQSHDVLTGLVNRSQFRSQARSASRLDAAFAVILIDINAFHEINESFGHSIGDAVLVEVASALQRRASPDEIVGRIGGDVFGIYLSKPPSREFVRDRALDLAGVFVQSFSTGDRNGTEFIARSACVGIASAPDDSTQIDTLFSYADAALAGAKARGPGSIVSYTSGMERDSRMRAALRNEIADAVAGNEFTLYYQPHLELATGRVTGCEALIRWNHPTRGLVLPGQFIPFAEQAGIITSIDQWVMRNAFDEVAELAAGRPGFRLYFNLSARQAADPRLVRMFVEAARRGVPLANIGIEITETDAMRDVAASRRIFRALRRLNVSIAIDDFGTGYSSLSSLKDLPVDIVKIDRAFVSGVTNNPSDAAIATTIISIADHFGFASLGEGAEEQVELDWLRRNKCRYVQGYAVCHPLPLDKFRVWLAMNDRAEKPALGAPARSRSKTRPSPSMPRIS